MLHEIPALKHVGRFTGDLQRDPFYRWLDRWFLLLQLPLGAGLYWAGELADVHGGGLGLVLWAIPLRLVLVYHVTWLVNSATHAFGYRNFESPDLSRNCWWVAILSFGEGWHNNHHAHAGARLGAQGPGGALPGLNPLTQLLQQSVGLDRGGSAHPQVAGGEQQIGQFGLQFA
jgi:fatty-acid desaturase